MGNITVGASEFVGRASTGEVRNLTGTESRTILNVESGSTADQTDAEIKTAYENNANSNEYSDAEQTTVLSVENNADVTDAANVALAGAVMDSDITPGEGFMRKTGAGAYTALKSNLSASVAPTVNEDTGDGYVIGSLWIDTTGDAIYQATDVTAGAAVWLNISASGGRSLASQAQAEAGTENTLGMTPLRVAQEIEGWSGRAEYFSADGTYNVPEDVSEVVVFAIGGGGGGAGGSPSSGGRGGGGAGWIHARVAVTPGGSETVQVGVGGTAGSGFGDGGAGEPSTFGTLVTANGGGAGLNPPGGGAGGSASTTGNRIAKESGTAANPGGGTGGHDSGFGGTGNGEAGDVPDGGGNANSGPGSGGVGGAGMVYVIPCL